MKMYNAKLIKYSKEIGEIRHNLRLIKRTGKAPINITLYRRLGLIRYKYVRGSSTEIEKLILTPKAKRILELKM